MVRFGAKTILVSDKDRIMFQFQYGAIWSIIPFAVQVGNALFQFQYGAIWSHILLKANHADNNVSIPVWCDLETSIL